MSIMYQEYIEDYIKEATNEMLKYNTEATDKSAVYKENYYLRDNLQIPFVSPVLSKRKNRDELVQFTSKFMDDHSFQLSTAGPIHIFMFGDKETSFLYEMFGVTGEQLVAMYHAMVNEAFFGKISTFFDGWVKNAPHKILLIAILIEALQKGYEDIVEVVEYLYAFSEYPIIYRLFWKTGVKEDVMTYTIEHLGAKFKVKKVSNLQALLKYDAHSSVSAKTEALLTGADNTYTDFMNE